MLPVNLQSPQNTGEQPCDRLRKKATTHYLKSHSAHVTHVFYFHRSGILIESKGYFGHPDDSYLMTQLFSNKYSTCCSSAQQTMDAVRWQLAVSFHDREVKERVNRVM